MREQDVIIVGGGPAGCVLSILLARSGLHVTLLEKDTHLDRTFRGPVYQPSAIRIWDEMGILEEISHIDHARFQNFSFNKGGKTLFKMDLTDLPPPYNEIFAIKQAPLLRCLINQAMQYPNFSYLGGFHAEGILNEEHGVAGVIAKSQHTEHILKARLVVAADGRFSTIRESIGCPLERAKQHFDVVWFELPNRHNITFDVGFQITDDGFLLFLPKEENIVQVGLVLGKGKYPDLRKRGIDAFIEQIAHVKPELKPLLKETLTSWDKCELLDVKIATAKEWVYNGLLLIGDAAHIASPVGGLGNKLAIEDAATAHPLIVKAIKNSKGTVQKDALAKFETIRRPDINKTLSFQKIAGKIAIEIQNPLLVTLRNALAPLMQKTPIFTKVRKLITMSPHDVHVDKSLFATTKETYSLLEIEDIVEETPTAKTLYFKVPEELTEKYHYQSGQHLTLRLLVDGIEHRRCYTISSPQESGKLSITVKQQEGGIVSTSLNESAAIGDRINVYPPEGDFILDHNATKQHFFFAGGSGITPIFAMISTLLHKNPSATIHLFYLNRNEAQTIFREAIHRLAERHPNFTLTEDFTAPEDVTWKGLTGRPTETMINEECKQFANAQTTYYLCGPKGFMDTTKKVLLENGVDSGSIRQELFYSLKNVYGELDHPPADSSEEATYPIETAESVTIDLRREQHTLEIGPDDTILDTALDAGLNAPFSCQRGICGTCKATLKEGRVRMETHDALTDEEIADGKILTCQAKLQSRTCHVSYDE